MSKKVQMPKARPVWKRPSETLKSLSSGAFRPRVCRDRTKYYRKQKHPMKEVY